ncbi:MAG: saccharopine dehydrogenase family protein [Bacteroidales bacterium]|nr:saccharopine dehydrogenase family protein [Bacteroidales bacterium]
MSKVLVIGCGGVASVAIAKICQNDKVFSEMCIASRTVSKCEAMKEKWQPTTSTKISTVQIDANSKEQIVALIKSFKPDVLLHVGMPYHNIVLMQACAENKVHYIDTAAYEPEDTNEPVWREGYEKRCKEKGFVAYFDYAEQWSYNQKFKDAGVTALLGGGFDPGVTNVFVAYAKKHFFDTIEYVDILDCNGGDHGYPFATNFNTEINLREVSSPADYYENGKWVGVPAMSIKREYDFPEVGKKDMYLLHHEEIESLTKNFPEIKRMRFYMTFGKSYLTHMKCLENVGLLNSTPVKFGEHKIIPIQFLKSLMPDPSTLGARTVGKTNIGCIFTGYKDGKKRNIYIYNVCDHQKSFKEVGSQAISYTTGVPAMISAALLATGQWKKAGVFNLEEFDPDPFMEMLNVYGLPWKVDENPVLVN